MCELTLFDGKRCDGCGYWVPLAYYYLSSHLKKRTISGTRSKCIACYKAAVKRNSEQVRIIVSSPFRTQATKKSFYDKQRRALEATAPRSHKIDRAAIIARDQGICHLCGATPTGRNLTLDHIVPLICGGDHAATNLRVACRSCNSRKGGRQTSEVLR